MRIEDKTKKQVTINSTEGVVGKVYYSFVDGYVMKCGTLHANYYPVYVRMDNGELMFNYEADLIEVESVLVVA